jgi:hypothetical protein
MYLRSELVKARKKGAAIEDLLRPVLAEARKLIPPGAIDMDLPQLRRWVAAWFLCWYLFWDALNVIAEV